jgi:hypothetical protein
VAGDTVLFKPATDFLLRGHAIPYQESKHSWGAEISITSHGKERKQSLVLHGERYWQWGVLKGWHLSDPTPCDQIDLRYELTYGGSYLVKDKWIRHDPNPVGRGILPERRMDKEVYYPAARIELMNNRLSAVDKPIAVPGLGPVPRTWASRRQYAGTYDTAWREGLKKNQRADYAKDFNPRFFQAAHPQWIFEPYWLGNEKIQLIGFTGDSGIFGQLPGWLPILNGQGSRGAIRPQPMNLDTVEVDLNRKRLYLTWRTFIDQSLQIEQASVHLQHPA